MKTNNIVIRPLNVDLRSSADGTKQYYMIQDNQNREFSCWSDTIKDFINNHLGQDLLVSVSENEKGFKTIRAIVDLNRQESSTEPKKEGFKPKSKDTQGEINKNVDLKAVPVYFTCLRQVYPINDYEDLELQKKAVDLVKYARENL